MIQAPPSSTRTDTLLPFTALGRSPEVEQHEAVAEQVAAALGIDHEHRRLGPRDHVLEASARQPVAVEAGRLERSEEHKSELPSLMRNSYAVFCLKKNTSNLALSQHLHTPYDTVTPQPLLPPL